MKVRNMLFTIFLLSILFVLASPARASFGGDDHGHDKPVSVPEPSTLLLLSSGLSVLGLIARRRKA